MRKVLILITLLITIYAVPSMACDPGNSASPSAAAPDSPSISSDAPSAAPSADIGVSPSASPSAASPGPAAAPGADLGGTDGGVGVDRKEFAIEVKPDCRWIIWNHCVNPVVGEEYDWLVDGEPWYKVVKHKE